MPWCPICRNEYREGIKVCAECQVELVDQLEDDTKEPSAGPYEAQMAAAEMFFDPASTADSGPDEEMPEDGEGSDEEPILYHAYQDSAVKAEDNKVSAYTLFVVGILGFAGVLLVFMDIIPVFQNVSTTKYLICGVMGALFILFIVFGVVSMRASKVLLVQAQSENSLVAELTKWCEENLDAEQIDRESLEEDMPEEQKYFKRTNRMKEIINNKFMNLDQGLLEHFIDEYYQNLFP